MTPQLLEILTLGSCILVLGAVDIWLSIEFRKARKLIRTMGRENARLLNLLQRQSTDTRWL